jgi:nitric oxide reductase large subunit
VDRGLGAERNAGQNVKRISHWAILTFEVITVGILTLILILAIQDFALRKFGEWYRNPAERTLKAFQQKQAEEFYVRLAAAAPFAVVALLLARPLVRHWHQISSPDKPFELK